MIKITTLEKENKEQGFGFSVNRLRLEQGLVIRGVMKRNELLRRHKKTETCRGGEIRGFLPGPEEPRREEEEREL